MKVHWTHFEVDPGSGGESIEFSFEWFPFFETECALIGRRDFFLPMLKHFMSEHSDA
ncbi:hypothetical protein [Burkholderia sp. RS02]|uniref:hypothetical protein n=1 Tax=unclassified Burkholderia TaxID=2613784 RepID=UPI003218150D